MMSAFGLKKYRLVCKSNHPFLVLKGANEKSFVVFQKVNGNYKKD